MKLAVLLFVVSLVLIACENSPLVTITTPDPNEDCSSGRFKEPIGLEVGGRGQFSPGNYHMDADPEPFTGEPVGVFEPLETFTVLEGPECHANPITSNTAILQQWRQWRVRSESRDLEGWVQEYAALMTQPTFYFVRPLADDATPLEIGSPLTNTVEFEGEVRLSEGLHQTHTIHFDTYGYASVSLEFDAPAGCDILAYEPSSGGIRIEDGEMMHFGEPVERWFVEPEAYELRVGYIFPGPQECDPVPYTLRFEPLS